MLTVISKKHFEIVKPDKELIELFNDIWKGERLDKVFTLFKDTQTSFSELFPNYANEVKASKSYKNKDDVIVNYLKENKSKNFLQSINNTYRTFLFIDKDSKKWDDDKWSIDNIKELYNKHEDNIENNKATYEEIDEFIVEKCHPITGNYKYSFATKVFSFMDLYLEKNRYPILDSISVTLLNQLYEKCCDENEKNRKKMWGGYKQYVEDYNQVLECLGLQEKSYKEFDIFLWLYGKAISEYWKKIGVISFNSVEYKPKTK